MIHPGLFIISETQRREKEGTAYLLGHLLLVEALEQQQRGKSRSDHLWHQRYRQSIGELQV